MSGYPTHFTGLLARLLLAIMFVTMIIAPPARAGYPEWPPPVEVVFGMPYMGHAVRPGNTGLITEVLKAVFKPTKYEMRHANMPYVRALELIKTDQVDFTLDVKGRHPDLIEGKHTLIMYHLGVASLRPRLFKQLSDLTDQPVAFLHGFGMQSQLPVPILPKPAFDLSSAYHMLDHGSANYVLGDVTLLKDALIESQLTMSAFVITPIKTLEVIPVFPDTPKGREIRDLYDTRMQDLIDSGKLTQILREQGLPESSLSQLLKANAR